MPDILYMFILLFAMAGITYIVRMIPLIVFKGKIKSTYIKSLLYYIPYAVLSAMTFPFILYSTGNFYAALIGTAVALVAAAFKLSLIIVAILACVAVFVAILIL